MTYTKEKIGKTRTEGEPDSFRALPDASDAPSASSEALPTPYEALPTLSKALPFPFEALSALSEALPGHSKAPPAKTARSSMECLEGAWRASDRAKRVLD